MKRALSLRRLHERDQKGDEVQNRATEEWMRAPLVQRVYARAEQQVQSWRQTNGEISLLDVIFPLSNPTNRSEALKIGGREEPIAQTNNSYIFPGPALGIVASKARGVTDAMIKAAAQELATRGFSQRGAQLVEVLRAGQELASRSD